MYLNDGCGDNNTDLHEGLWLFDPSQINKNDLTRFVVRKDTTHKLLEMHSSWGRNRGSHKQKG